LTFHDLMIPVDCSGRSHQLETSLGDDDIRLAIRYSPVGVVARPE